MYLAFRIPKPVDFSLSLGDHFPKNLMESLSALRTRIVVMAGQEAPTVSRSRRKSATQHGGSTLADLHQALEDYLPVLLGLVKDGSQLQHKVQFVWINQEDDAEETAISNAWYEVLSVLHLMAMLSLSQANLLLLPRTSADGYHPKVSEESRRASIDIFLKAAGYLDCAIRTVLPQLPTPLRKDLPVDLAEGVLRALCLQALGQSVDIQLGMAIDSAKATLAVKRRLACEMVKSWQQAQDNIMNLPLANGWGGKHRLFIKWKYVEAKILTYDNDSMYSSYALLHEKDELPKTELFDWYWNITAMNLTNFLSSPYHMLLGSLVSPSSTSMINYLVDQADFGTLETVLAFHNSRIALDFNLMSAWHIFS
ncbi:hypothetical protein OIU77_021642 [Salix suchowensis]|uniref:BRO1 domain-containing protein n=1 Tax=Salix suchowensis TaxID=1278906 RepID=A0ABQ9CEH5_9ROSI|nr:hypothetical protein OIU77_021642 [Salix suchowensis]